MEYSNESLIKAIVDYVNTVGEEEGVDLVDCISDTESRKIIINIMHEHYEVTYKTHNTYYHPKEN